MAPETPKGVSSRLLTMKFMQRAAASASSAGSPDSEAPSSKKRKLEHSPAQGRINTNIDQALIQAALDQEEATRQAALEKHSTADTHWVLDNKWGKAKPTRPASNPLNVVYVGYGDFDSADESGDNEDAAVKGRTSTKPPPKATKKGATKDGAESDSDKDSSDEQSSSDDEEPKRKRRNGHSSDNTPTSRDRSRSQSRSRPNAEGVKAKEFRDKRKKKEVRLNQLTSISGGGGATSSNRSMKCYTCQQENAAGKQIADALANHELLDPSLLAQTRPGDTARMLVSQIKSWLLLLLVAAFGSHATGREMQLDQAASRDTSVPRRGRDVVITRHRGSQEKHSMVQQLCYIPATRCNR